MATEGLAVHVLILKWSALVAWIFTIGTVYGALWLIADYRATVLRPILVSDESILIRAGFRCILSRLVRGATPADASGADPFGSSLRHRDPGCSPLIRRDPR